MDFVFLLSKLTFSLQESYKSKQGKTIGNHRFNPTSNLVTEFKKYAQQV